MLGAEKNTGRRKDRRGTFLRQTQGGSISEGKSTAFQSEFPEARSQEQRQLLIPKIEGAGKRNDSNLMVCSQPQAQCNLEPWNI